MKKILLLSLACLIFSISALAVLNEQDLVKTLSVLRNELENSYKKQQENLARYAAFDEMQHTKMLNLIQKSNQIALMLYSQKQEYTFNMTYACHEATSQYQEYLKERMPYYSILERLEVEIQRYSRLIESLENIPPRIHRITDTISLSQRWIADSAMQDAHRASFILSKEKQIERDSCVRIATDMRENLIHLCENIKKDNGHYDQIAHRLKTLNDYAMERYTSIQQNIFKNGDVSYLSILSRLPFYYNYAVADIIDKYATNDTNDVQSEWRGEVVVGLALFVLFYLFVAVVICNLFIWIFVPKRFKTLNFKKRKNYYILAGSILIFAFVVTIAQLFITHNFFVMASRLLVEFACLMGAILCSLLIRLKADQIHSGFRIYVPIMLMGFIVIVFRIIFIPNSVVCLIFPPILLLFTIWQLISIKKHNKNIPRNDIFYTWISLIAMIVSCCFSWYGYTLLAVQIFIWWIFQLTFIQGITCFYDLMKIYECKVIARKIAAANGDNPNSRAIINQAIEAYNKRKGDHVIITWFGDMINIAIIPVLGVLSILLCIYWAADVFDLAESCQSIFFTNFVNVVDVCQLSLFKITIVAGFYFVFRYINYLLKSIYRHIIINRNIINGQANMTLANNVIAILVWGTYFIFALILLKVPKSGISIVTAGLATGIGFAMKDILENFFYGISLMTGRVRVGEYIECDGIRGKVESITYQSTQILTPDGSIIAFLNSSLFNKNFKNLTRNHGYEFIKLPIGVAYGVNVDDVRKMLTASITKHITPENGIEYIDYSKGINVILNEFGDNSVNLYITFWVLVEAKFKISGKVNEIIYNTLNENHIEIPFPQRDVYVRDFKIRE